MNNRKKSYWYVMVVTNNDCRFVTSINNVERVSYWNADETPKAMTRSMAFDLLYGLRINGFTAFAVCHPYKLEDHRN